MAEETLLILKDNVTDENFYSFVGNLGFRLIDQLTPDEGYAFQMVYASADGSQSVRFVIEPIVHLPCLIIRGEDQESLAARAYLELDVTNLDEIKQMYDMAKTSNDRRKALAYTALASLNDYDQWVYDVLVNALKDSDPEVRADAIFVMRYAAQPELIALAEQTKCSDPDPNVRAESEAFLSAFQSWRGDNPAR